MSDSEWEDQEDYDPTFQRVQIAWKPGSAVVLVQPKIVMKHGTNLRPCEATAMRLARKHLPDLPVPRPLQQLRRFRGRGDPYYSELDMDLMPGKTLSSVWASLDECKKERVCRDMWDHVAYIRTMPRPSDLGPGLYRTADGSPCRDPLVGDKIDPAPPEFDDHTLRERIWARYVGFMGLSVRDGRDVRHMLPHCSRSVFCHGGIRPDNILVDDEAHITAVLNWGSSGWFPEYWEYLQMMTSCDPKDHEWQQYMSKTRPEPWNIEGLLKARRVLF